MEEMRLAAIAATAVRNQTTALGDRIRKLVMGARRPFDPGLMHTAFLRGQQSSKAETELY